MTVRMSTICPTCGCEHDAATLATMLDDKVGNPLPRVPSDGDASLCIACGTFSVFDDRSAGGMRKPTKKEQRMLDRDDRINLMRDGWECMKAVRQ